MRVTSLSFDHRQTARAYAVCVAILLAAMIGACTSTSLTGPSGSVVKCHVTLTASTAAPADGGNGSVTVAAAPECAWSASTQTAWISDLAPASGQGGATIQFKVAANTAPSARQGDIVVNDATVRVSQEASPCRFEVTPGTVGVPGDGGSASTAVTAVSGCTWTAASQATWLTITSGQSGDGNGTVAFTAAANPDQGSPRTGTLVVAGLPVTVTQPARNCTFTLAPTSQNFPPAGGTGTVAVTSGVNCGWTATSNAPWLTVTSGSTGSGNGSFGFSVAASTGIARTGEISAGGAIFTVTQDLACSFSIAPTSQSVNDQGGSGTTTVSTSTGCTWTATSNASFLTITGGASGSGPGTVTFTIAQNTSTSGQRSGTLTVAGQTFTVNQGPAPCVFSATPQTQNVGAAGGPASIAVTTTAGCAWTASTSVSWLHITAGASGNTAGNVSVTVDQNTGVARSGQLQVAGQTVTINQASAPCAFAVSPMSQQVNVLGTNRTTLSLTALPTCTWTASSSDSWIHVTTGSGTGSATINFTIDPNPSSSPRSGGISISGSAPTVTAAVAQDALVCNYSLTPTSASVSSAAGSGGQIAITANIPSLCSWTASTADTWLHLMATGGSGSGTLDWTYDANTGPARMGSIAISGQSFSVSQANGCTYSTPTPPLTGVPGNMVTAASFAVATSAGCTWTATSNDAWLTITGGTATGSGPATVTFAVAANPTGVIRSGTLSLQGQPIFRVIQDP